MDQVKVFLRQCVKNRFWIALGISMLLPVIGYFIGAGAINKATEDQEKAITSAKTDIEKYTSPGVPNNQYAPIVEEKKEVLDKDVDATWRKLFALQEPLLRWPEVVEPQFREWGRKWPENVDQGRIQRTLIDYTIAYPEFVSKVYKTFNPWNPEDGTGIVAAPDEKLLIQPAPFTIESPPDLGKVWAEQERLWVFTALLDVVAKVNESVGAKDWDGAVIKQIQAIEVGTMTAQDQVSLANAVELVEAPELGPEGEGEAVEEDASEPGMVPGMAPGMESMGAMRGMMGGMGPASNPGIVYSLPVEENQQFKVLPIKMTVLVDQAHLADFLIGLENSPMAIQVLEPEIAKPLTPVVKPVYGQNMSFGMGGYGGMMQPGMMPGMTPGMMPGMTPGMGGGMPGMESMMRGRGMGGMPGMMPGMTPGMGRGGMGPGMMPGMGGMMGGTATVRKGTDVRSVNRAQQRKDEEKKASEKSKLAEESKVDVYYNVIEVTVYGQARFYNAPPAPGQEESSTSESTPETAPEDAADQP